jgi:signal transduction histidine kinase
MTNSANFSIFIVEDNAGDFELVEEFLFEQIETLNIQHAWNFKEAKGILSLKRNKFDVILLDLSLPDKTGMELINEITAISSNIPIIVLTGYADNSFGVASLSKGVCDYILKEELTPLVLYKSIIYSIERKRITSSLEESEKSIRGYASRLGDILEEERARIAREIHDEFGQQLSGLKMALSSLKRADTTYDTIAPLIDIIVADVDYSIQSLRQIANELRPVIIDKLGLFAAIEWLITEFEKKTGITSILQIEINNPIINKVLEINIFRICQEALANIAKHAKASLVTIVIKKTSTTLNIKIMDNGKGIKSSTLHNPLSMGLLNMKERANVIDAQINITSSLSKGTIIELIIDTNAKKNIDSRRPLHY